MIGRAIIIILISGFASAMLVRTCFDLYVISVVGPVPILAEVVGAGLGQWENSPKEWGQGWSAFGERIESSLAYNGIRETISYGPQSCFTKIIDISLRIEVVSGHELATPFLALLRLGIPMGAGLFPCLVSRVSSEQAPSQVFGTTKLGGRARNWT
jgi:hypothetical protein